MPCRRPALERPPERRDAAAVAGLLAGADAAPSSRPSTRSGPWRCCRWGRSSSTGRTCRWRSTPASTRPSSAARLEPPARGHAGPRAADDLRRQEQRASRLPGHAHPLGRDPGRVWYEIGASVRRAGVRKLLLLNSHGGQPQVMQIVARELRIEHGMLAVAANWFSWGLPRRPVRPEAEVRHGIHAGAIETAMMLAVRPDLVGLDRRGGLRARDRSRTSASSPASARWAPPASAGRRRTCTPRVPAATPAGHGRGRRADPDLRRRAPSRPAAGAGPLPAAAAAGAAWRLGGGYSPPWTA